MEYILSEYGDNILRMAYSYLHSLEDSEDILQETLIKYISSAPSFESAGHEKAWLLRVAANLSKNKIKYNRIRSYDELKDELITKGREDLTSVWDAVRELPELNDDLVKDLSETADTVAEWKEEIKQNIFGTKKTINTSNINKYEEYTPGEKVKHDKYGEGVVITVESSILTIAFAHPHGIVKIMKGHKSLKKIEE